MDPGRYGLRQGWDNNSALQGFGGAHDHNYRYSGYDERYSDDRFGRDSVCSYGSSHDGTGMWPHSRRRGHEVDQPRERDSRRREKSCGDPFHENDAFHDGYQSMENYYLEDGIDRLPRFDRQDYNDYAYEDHEYRSRNFHQGREISRERDYDYGRFSYDSDYERSSRRDSGRRSRDSRDREWDRRSMSRERDQIPYRRHERSWSRGRDDRSRSRSPRGRSRGRNHREDSYEDDWLERSDRRRDWEERRRRDHFSSAPSATVVVKGLSQKTTEEDLYQILTEWGPLRHVRVIKERNSGISRGFAFIDFPSVGAARAMMDRIGDDGLVVDGRKVFFQYSKPTGGTAGSFVQENVSRLISGRNIMPSDWICMICGCINFARRTSCFQCNEPRTEDAPPADVGLSNPMAGRRGLEAGPTHVLVVRGLDENADEEMLRYEFSKHAPIKDLRLVRDKFTHVSRGFAFVHFHSVEDATKALEASNGTALEKNGQILRVAYAKSVLGPGSGPAASSHSSSLAAAAIEAAAFSQQYDAVGWAPKEYNPDDKQYAVGHEQGSQEVGAHNDGSAVQSGFVWDETSGYYYDAASGYYYDGNTGLYYDSNSGAWYMYDYQMQQYVPCVEQNSENRSAEKSAESAKAVGSNDKKVVISAPAATKTSAEKMASLPDAVEAAAAAALAAEKKEKEKSKEVKIASKSSILASKKKMNNVLTMWKQRSHEAQIPRLSHDSLSSLASEEKSFSAGLSRNKYKSDATVANENRIAVPGGNLPTSTIHHSNNNSSGTLTGVIRNPIRGVVKSDSTTAAPSVSGSFPLMNLDSSTTPIPFRTDVSALGSYRTPAATGGGRRRFSEMPTSSALKDQPQPSYRDRAAERRSLYGSSSIRDDLVDSGFGDSNREFGMRKGSSDPTPFPPGVGGGRGASAEDAENYDLITADRAIDESNVGNRMLRSMGWHEGVGLGRDGSGMIEPVQAQATDRRAGLGSHQKKLDPSLEVHAGDSYKTVIQKKALARFREMSEADR